MRWAGRGGAPLECGMEALELWEGCFTMCETVTRMLGDTLECLGETLECMGETKVDKKGRKRLSLGVSDSNLMPDHLSLGLPDSNVSPGRCKTQIPGLNI